MKQSLLRKLLGLVAALIALALLSFVLTVLLFPFWSWLESSFGIESIGHSGPAEWCFWLVFGIAAVAFGSVTGLRLRARQR